MGLVSALTVLLFCGYAFQLCVVLALFLTDLGEPRRDWKFKTFNRVLVNLIPGMLPYLTVRKHFREPQ